MKYILFSFLLFATSVCYAQRFKVKYNSSVFKEAFSGQVLLYLSKTNKAPKDGRPGLEVFPCFRMQVKNIKPDNYITFDDHAVSYPGALSDIERGEYYVQVVWDRDLGDRSIGAGSGNLYSTSDKVMLNKESDKEYFIVATKIVSPHSFIETAFTKEMKTRSELLSSFSGKPEFFNAAVHLPKEYLNEPTRKFPVLFTILGFGSDYRRYSAGSNPCAPIDTTSCITVYLDGRSRLGHSGYANSDNNGPWSDALVKEFIPLLEKSYRCNGARLLTGHSSGGWAAIWLQTHYPGIFHGCWSSAPDPVDFRSFHGVDLYKDANMFYAPDSSLRQTGTVGGVIPWFNMRNIYRMEHVVYRGEQMHSFDAIFSKTDAKGSPERICSNISGEIDTSVFEHWKKYDISRYLRNNWQHIKPALIGKVRVSVGTSDNFSLNRAVELLETTMRQLNGQFVFEYYPGDHFTVSTPQYQKDGLAFLQEKYFEWIKNIDTQRLPK
jgi:hypothetical protein